MSGAEIPLMLLGTGAKAIGDVTGASAQADAAKKQAALKQEQAQELLSREQINEQIMRDQANKETLQAGSMAAGTGLGGGGIGMKLAIFKNLNQTIANSQRDAQFKAKMLNEGADIDQSLASDYETSGILRGTSTILTGAGGIYRDTQPPSSTRVPLPTPPGAF